MARACLAAALFGASIVAGTALRNRATVESETAMADWKYFPPNAQIGIVTGGPPEAYTKMNFAAQTASIMFKYAQKHGYAFYVEKNLPHLGNRKKYWNKVLLMHKLLREVPYLVWMDPEMVIKDLDTPMEELMQTAQCDGAEQKQWMQYLPHRQNNETFMWLNADKSPHRYVVNANTGMVIMKRVPESFHFLTKVWEIGNDADAYKHYKDELHWLKKNESSPDHGWPFEQGAFWDVMTEDPSRWLKGSCIAEGSHFHSVRAYLYAKGHFAASLYGLPDKMIRDQAHSTLLDLHIKAEIH